MPVRLKILQSLIYSAFIFLLCSLVYHQLLKGNYYFQLSQNNSIKLLRSSPARGMIYERQNRVLAGKRLVFNVAILSFESKNVEQILAKISPILNISQEELWRRFKKNCAAPFIPAVIVPDVPQETAIALECQEAEIPGLVIQTEALRDYPYGKSTSHVLGYLGQVSEQELARLKMYGLRVKDLVGRGGLEEEFDYYLRGQAGGRQVQVDNRGRQVRVLGEEQAQAGSDLYLSIDAQLQELVDALFTEDKKGACIVMDPQNGEILAMVSKPSFNSNLFITALNNKSEAGRKVKEILNSEEAILVNRAISGAYPPGSIFKIVVAAAGLETEKITAQTIFDCPGSLKVGNRDFFCWNLDGHGRQNLIEAIAHSCNVFFYKLGLALGPDKLTFFARKFGLGRASEIDLPHESAGFVPSASWKLRRFREKWYDGDTANFAIGQGELLTTPLQIARALCAAANGGYLVQPHLVKRIGEQEIKASREKLAVKKETLAIIKEGMHQVIGSEQGTGRGADIPGVQWAAKTGTAQTTKGVAHGWFAGFYPLKEPRILVLVFLEYGGTGGDIPASIAKQVIGYIKENELNESSEKAF